MASILETFYILFESNAEKVRLEADALVASGERVAQRLGAVETSASSMGKAIADSGKLGRFEISELDRTLAYFNTHLIHQLVDLASGFAGLFALEKIGEGFFNTAEMVDQLGHVSKELGINVSDLDAWNKTVQRNGGTAEAFEGSLRALAARLAAVEVGTAKSQGAVKYLHELGINAADAHGKMLPLLDILPRIADAFQGKSAQETSGIGRHLGLDPATILTLQSGRQAIEDMIAHEKSLGVVTAENVEVVAKFKDAWQDLHDTLEGGALTALDDILPIITDLIRAFDFLYAHKTFIVSLFETIAAVVTTVYGPAMWAAARATLAATWPWLLLAAAILVAALAFDDIRNYIAGNNSALGEMVKKYPELGAVLKDIGNVAKVAWDTFAAGAREAMAVLLLVVEALTNPRKAFADFNANISKIWTNFSQQMAAVIAQFPGLSQAFDAVWKVFQRIGGDIEGVFDKIGGAIGRVERFAGITGPGTAPRPVIGPGGIPGYPDLGPAQAGFRAGNSPIMSQSSFSLSGQSPPANVTVTVGDINVNAPNADAATAARLMHEGLTDKITQALTHFDTGVRS